MRYNLNITVNIFVFDFRSVQLGVWERFGPKILHA